MVAGAPDYTKVIVVEQPDVGVQVNPILTVSSAENSEQKKISATAVESITSFTQEVRSVLLYNEGPNAVHINFDATATTNSLKIPLRGALTLDLKTTDIHTICAATETATVWVIGLWS